METSLPAPFVTILTALQVHQGNQSFPSIGGSHSCMQPSSVQLPPCWVLKLNPWTSGIGEEGREFCPNSPNTPCECFQDTSLIRGNMEQVGDICRLPSSPHSYSWTKPSKQALLGKNKKKKLIICAFTNSIWVYVKTISLKDGRWRYCPRTLKSMWIAELLFFAKKKKLPITF